MAAYAYTKYYRYCTLYYITTTWQTYQPHHRPTTMLRLRCSHLRRILAPTSTASENPLLVHPPSHPTTGRPSPTHPAITPHPHTPSLSPVLSTDPSPRFALRFLTSTCTIVSIESLTNVSNPAIGGNMTFHTISTSPSLPHTESDSVRNRTDTS